MEDLKVCRVCLITNVRMLNMHSFPYEHYFLTSTGISYKRREALRVKLLDNMKLPKYACYECAALVKKCYNFREKCIKGQSILFNIMGNTGEISYQKIANLDRLDLKLSSDLDVNQNTNIAFEFIYEYDQKAIDDIKDEPSSGLNIDDDFRNYDNIRNYDDDISNFDDETRNYDGDDHNDDAKNNENNKIEIQTEVIKEEMSYDENPMLLYISSDDDKPLSVHKSNKEKIKKKTGKKRGHKTQDVKLDLVAQDVKAVETLKDISELVLERAKPKPKRGRPPKAATTLVAEKEQKPRRTQNTGGVEIEDIDLEQYVTVIKLSLKEQLEEVSMRQNSSNYVNSSYKCNLCYRGFIDTDAWKHHVVKHDPSSGDVECPVCKFRFKTKRALQKHYMIHEKKYACNSCSYVSKTTTQAKQHQRWHKGVTYKCQYCEEVLTKWTSYLSHVRIKHPSEFICDVCGYSFVSKLGLTLHRSMMHKNVGESQPDGAAVEEGPYCAECNVKFISLEGYKRHLVTSAKHIQTLKFQNGCRTCGEMFNSSEELRLHHRKEHAKKRPKNYGKKPTSITFPAKCEHCSVVMESAREYYVHFRRAHPDEKYPIQKDYVCDVCGKSFRGNAFLVYHKRTHQEERTFPCTMCDKAFFNRANLLMHARTHSDHRPYGCSVCCKAFKCKAALDRHFRSHTGVKPYECEVCGKAFGQSNSRKLHVRTVHLKQPAPYVSRARLERRARPARDHGLYTLDH